jgi:hypothetical protein
MTEEKKVACVVCAWRKDCLKKFRYQPSPRLRCPDYTRDLTLPEEKDKDT